LEWHKSEAFASGGGYENVGFVVPVSLFFEGHPFTVEMDVVA
jgi:hypothetical protein